MLSLPSEPLYELLILKHLDLWINIHKRNKMNFCPSVFSSCQKKVVLRNTEEFLANMELALGIGFFYSVFWGDSKIEGPLCAPPSNMSYCDITVIVWNWSDRGVYTREDYINYNEAYVIPSLYCQTSPEHSVANCYSRSLCIYASIHGTHYTILGNAL